MIGTSMTPLSMPRCRGWWWTRCRARGWRPRSCAVTSSRRGGAACWWRPDRGWSLWGPWGRAWRRATRASWPSRTGHCSSLSLTSGTRILKREEASLTYFCLATAFLQLSRILKLEASDTRRDPWGSCLWWDEMAKNTLKPQSTISRSQQPMARLKDLIYGKLPNLFQTLLVPVSYELNPSDLPGRVSW